MTDPLDALRWRDELLQILYWLRGEGLGDAPTAAELLPFLPADPTLIAEHLARLAAGGYAEASGGDPPRYSLTPLGVREGGRRFADEFAGLTGQAHGECNNPDCACKTLGPAACEGHHVH
ncbi:MAG TPA: hypothetical protein PKD53_03895 [Chloroflexaceae bacterium]|nr:hypothetical protein [Chloroflexaceae bacterium]